MRRARFLADHFGHPQQRARLEPLRRADDDGRRGQRRRRARHDCATAMRRNRGDDKLRVSQGIGKAVGDRHTRWKRYVREVGGVGASRRQFVDQRRIARPQPDVVSKAPKMQSEIGDTSAVGNEGTSAGTS